ncbi:hypothetical protein ES704_03485 [subsurface metagenome]|jgi:hypothetical protein
MIAIKAVTGPTLVAGAFDVTFGQFEKVVAAAVSFDNPATSDYVFGASRAISGNVVTITVKKIDVTQASPIAWANAVTADVAAMVFTVVAKGE